MKYKSILCPIDGTELGSRAIEHAVYIGKLSGAKVTFLYVSEKAFRLAHITTDSKEWQAIHEEWMNEGREILKKAKADLKGDEGKNVDIVIRDGEASNEIVAEAMEQGADLIIMASHRYSAVGKVFHGSVTDRVTKRSPCPVLWVFK